MAGMFGRKKTRLATPTLHELKCGAEAVEFLWVRGIGRRLRLEVRPDGGVRVHSPARAGFDEVLSFVAAKAAWILRSRERVRARERLTWPDSSRARVRLRTGAERLLRERMDLCLLLTSGKARRVGLAHGLTLTPKGRGGPASGSASPPVSFRMMKRRWGSYGRDGRVVLNVRLAQLPVACVDYVILHELCHLRHHHHGRAFYDLLDRVVPDWKLRKKELDHFVIV